MANSTHLFCSLPYFNLGYNITCLYISLIYISVKIPQISTCIFMFQLLKNRAILYH